MNQSNLSLEELEELAALDSKYPLVRFIHHTPNDVAKYGATVGWFRNHPSSRLIHFSIASLNPADLYNKKRGRLVVLRQIDKGNVITLSSGWRGTKGITANLRIMVADFLSGEPYARWN